MNPAEIEEREPRLTTPAQRIRWARLKAGVSVRALAQSGVSASFICHVERGKRNPSTKTLRQLAPILGVSAYWLETGHEAPDLADIKPHDGTRRVLGYIRVSTAEQGISGAGLQAQRNTITAECERRGWTLLEIVEDAGWSGGTMD